MLSEILGSSLAVFIGFTVVLFGFAAWMTGQALASGWHSFGRTGVFYSLLLAAGNRFLVYALFGGPLLSLSGFIVSMAVVLVVGFLAFRITQVGKMVSQYPWLYERAGLFAWRDRQTG